MYEREPLERFLYTINRKQTWAGLFSFAMTVVGLLAVMGLVVLTVWGFASYSTEHTKLTATNAELANTQVKVVELTRLANSNSTNAELLSVRAELSNVRTQISQKDQQIADLQKQLANGNTAPSSPVAPANCENCESRMKEVVIGLRSEIARLQKQLDECNARPKRPTKDAKTNLVQ